MKRSQAEDEKQNIGGDEQCNFAGCENSQPRNFQETKIAPPSYCNAYKKENQNYEKAYL